MNAPAALWRPGAGITEVAVTQLELIDGHGQIPYGFCQCGCGQQTRLAPVTSKAKGWVKGEPLKYVFPHKARTAATERFWVMVDKTESCWLWRGALHQGYGRFSYGDGRTQAHRYAYRLLVGPIPDDLTLDHLCRTRNCVNPAHLEPVSPGENVLRGIGPAAMNARKTRCVRGHEFTPENTVRYKGSRYCRTCNLRKHRGRAA